MSPFLQQAFANTWFHIKLFAVIILVGLLLERLRPAERAQPLTDIGFNLIYIPIVLLLNELLLPPLVALTAPWIRDFGFSIPVHLPDGVGWQLLQALAYFAIYDFFYYWFHRAQHVVPVLWAQHKLHHSEISLNVSTNMRHHWLESPFRVFLVALPIGVLFDQKPVTVAWIANVAVLWSFFIHMNVRLRLGLLTGVFAGPQVHRIHHSIEREHTDRNFAAYLPIFDIVFRTWVRPGPDTWPATGLHDGERMNRLDRALLSPFGEWWRMLRRNGSKHSPQRTIEPPPK